MLLNKFLLIVGGLAVAVKEAKAEIYYATKSGGSGQTKERGEQDPSTQTPDAGSGGDADSSRSSGGSPGK